MNHGIFSPPSQSDDHAGFISERRARRRNHKVLQSVVKYYRSSWCEVLTSLQSYVPDSWVWQRVWSFTEDCLCRASCQNNVIREVSRVASGLWARRERRLKLLKLKGKNFDPQKPGLHKTSFQKYKCLPYTLLHLQKKTPLLPCPPGGTVCQR